MVYNSIHHLDLLLPIQTGNFRGNRRRIVMSNNHRKNIGSLTMIYRTASAWHPRYALLPSLRFAVNDWNGYSMPPLNITRGLVGCAIGEDGLDTSRLAQIVAPSHPFQSQYLWVLGSASVSVQTGISSSVKGTSEG
jgi:hypothetical protein